MRRSRLIAALASVAGVIAIAGFSVVAKSADHQDAPAVKAAPGADINDLFTWMDGNNVVLAMTVNPAATTTTLFDNTVQYVFHTSSTTVFTGSIPAPSKFDVDVIATFDNATPQNIQLWVGTAEYLTGNPNVAAGLASTDGKVKVYAAPVADPFFFNLDGFHAAVADVVMAAGVPADAGGLTFNQFGCPALDTATSDTLVGQLAKAPGGITAPVDHFATLDGLGIVVSVDKSLLTANGAHVSVWAATYSPPTAADAGAG